MNDATQLPLSVDVRGTLEAAGVKLLTVVAEAIGASGKQGDDFAADIGVDPGQFSRALAGRGVHFSVRWIPAVIWRDRKHVLIRHLCALAGGDFMPKPKRTREDENEALRRYVEEHMGEHGLDVIKHALGEDA